MRTFKFKSVQMFNYNDSASNGIFCEKDTPKVCNPTNDTGRDERYRCCPNEYIGGRTR